MDDNQFDLGPLENMPNEGVVRQAEGEESPNGNNDAETRQVESQGDSVEEALPAAPAPAAVEEALPAAPASAVEEALPAAPTPVAVEEALPAAPAAVEEALPAAAAAAPALSNSLIERAGEDLTEEAVHQTTAAPQETRPDQPNVGLYPDTTDDRDDFIRRLLEKQEFAESYQEPLFDPEQPIDPTTIGDEEDRDFELTPVQRFIANFLSPETPYRSVLLYHGVGVGKTCAAVTTAERFLATFPRQKVFIAAPPRIQNGFMNNIFDINKVRFGNDELPNHASQCTGDTYLRLTSSFYIDKTKASVIDNRVKKVIKKRYEFFGYVQLKKHIQFIMDSVPEGLSEEQRRIQQNKRLNQEFSGRLLIIDEAHNLNDKVSEDENADVAGGVRELSDRSEGKELTPYLIRILEVVEDMKLMLMTGTPMYNEYKEILFLLNLLLLNDKKKPLEEGQIFNPNKADIFKPGGITMEDGSVTRSGRELLGEVASKYVSFMRGENPKYFPLRLSPNEIRYPKVTQYPPYSVNGTAKLIGAGAFTQMLPIVPSMLEEDAAAVMSNLQRIILATKGGASAINTGALLRYGNIIYPPTEDIDASLASKEQLLGRVGEEGFRNLFEARKSGARYVLHDPDSSEWLSTDYLGAYSPKMKTIAKSVLSAEGVCFIFSQYVKAGAIPMAIVLEANGFSPFADARPMLGNGWRHPDGRVCVCGLRERRHVDVEHAFNPARYGLLTGETPDGVFKQIVEACQRPDNTGGEIIKVIIGSEIAGEGIDLRYIRENHLLDSWFHLNKTEQVVGRAIRFKSHMALPFEKRNTTIFLHANMYPPSPRAQETVDLYVYRMAFKKAKEVGQVTRVLKSYAVDCNLNHNMVVFKGLPRINIIDSQHEERREVSIDDVEFSPLCDFMESCDFQCMPEVDIKKDGNDESTYTHFAAQWRSAQLREVVRNLFKNLDVPFFQKKRLEMLPDFAGLPKAVLNEILNQIINRKDFVVKNNGQNGYLIYNNGYIVFQPKRLSDKGIPLALRTGFYPVKRDNYMREKLVLPEEVVGGEAIVASSSSAKALSLDQIMAGFNGFTEWIDALRVDINSPMPSSLKDEYLYNYSGKDMREVVLFQEMGDTIRFFAAHMLNLFEEDQAEDIWNVIAEFIFDEWFKEEDKAKFIQTSGFPIDENLVKEHLLYVDDDILYRYVDVDTGKLQYICNDGSVCEPSLIAALKTQQDPLADEEGNYVLSEETTGRFYGFLTWNKVGKMTFKTNTPPKVPNKIDKKGTECRINTTTSTHRNNITLLGKVLNEEFENDLGFSANGILRTEVELLKNPNRICTIFDLLLRWMDKKRVQEKRWFYRSVMAYLTNHRGLRSGLGEGAKLVRDEVKPKAVRSKKKVVVAKAKPATA